MYNSYITSNLDGVEMLANAVVLQAAKDYREALCKRDKVEIGNLERFFHGEDIKLYTKVDGKYIAEELKKQVEECEYNLHRVRKLNDGKSIEQIKSEELEKKRPKRHYKKRTKKTDT